MKKSSFILGLTFLVVWCSCLRSQPEKSLLEETTAYWTHYQPGPNTLVLYHFDPPDPAADASGPCPSLQFPPGVIISPEGYWGSGLLLKAGHSPLRIELAESLFERNRFIIDFWFKTEALPPPGEKVFLLYKPHQYQKSNGLALSLADDGSLTWYHRTLSSSEKSHPEWYIELKSAPAVVKAGRWHHVAVYVGSFTHVYRSEIAYLALDGRILTEEANGWRYINYGIKEEGKTSFFLGSAEDGKQGFAGTIDQFRILSGLYRKFYPQPEENFVDPDNRRPLPDKAEFFAGSEEVLFKAGFENSLTAEVARGKPEPVKAPKEVQFAPGVKGKALILPPGYKPIGYAAKGNLNPGCGSVEMWVKPLGWQQLGTLLQWFFWTENQGPTFLIPNDGFTVMVSGGAENMEVDYPPDTWTHFILTWADRLIRLYVNGQEKLSSFMTVPFDPNKDYVSFGPGSGKPMLIDELTIYKRAFSAAEVANHYHRYVGRKNFTPLPAIDCVTNFFQGAGRIAGVAFTRGRKETGQMRIQLSAKGQPVEETTVPYHPEKGAVFLLEKLPVPLPQGEYFLKFEFQDKADGKILLSSTRPFSFKFYPWLGNTIGLTERVLKPWTPMKEKDGVIEVVGRQHQLDKTGLFSSLINQGKEMLAEPMRLEVTASEKTFSLAGTGTRILTRKATEVHWQSQAVGQVSSQILKVNIDGLMEYDGHTVFTLKTNPPDKPPLKIDRFSLVLPLKADLPQFFLTVFGIGLPYGVGTFPHCGQLPRHEGNIFSSKVWYEYVGWDGQLQQTGVFDLRTAVAISEKTLKLQKRWKPTLGNFLPQLWVGNDEIGLSYMADNDRGWIPVDEEAAITLERKGQVVEWRFNFISLPYLLKEAREIVLSFQATPEKPLPQNWRKHFWRGPKRNDGGISCVWLSDSAGWDEEGVSGHAYQPEKAREATEKFHAMGLKVTPHLDTSSLNWGASTAREFAAEWSSGGIQYNMIFTRSKIDFMVWSHQKWKQQYGIDGVYFDTGTPRPNYNTISGTAYFLPDGRLQPGWTMFGQREVYKRSAHVFGDVGTEGFNWSCGYTGSQIAGWQWAAVPGGEYRIDYATDSYPGPFDLMRIYSNSGKFGTMMMWMGLSEYVKLREAPASYEKFFRHMYAMMLPLDAKWPFGSFTYPDAFSDFCIADPDVKFVGFWKNPLVNIQPATESVKVSAYVKPHRSLWIVSNLAPQDARLQLKIDLSSLGWKPENVQVVDAEEKESKRPERLTIPWYYWINRGGCALIPEEKEELRQVKVSSEKNSLLVNLFVPGHDYRLLSISERQTTGQVAAEKFDR